MNFTSIVDLIKIFANEYCVPGSLVLFIGQANDEIRKIFKFINSELIVVDSIKGPSVDILLNSNYELPFENHSFDLIIKNNNLSNLSNLSIFLKTNGKLLINESVIDSIDYYFLCNQTFSVV